MAKQLQIRGGTTVQHSTFTGAAREITVDTDKDVVVVHNGTTVGGFPLAKQTSVDSKVTKVTSTDNAVVRFDGTTGQVQNSGVIIDDNNTIFSGVIYSGGTSRGNGSLGVKRLSDNLTVGSFTADDTNSRLSIATAYSNITFSDYAGDRLSIVGGNVGIGVTPSAWTTYKVLELGAGNGMHGSNGPGQELHVSNNAYYNSGYKYALSYSASDYKQEAGTHQWRTAPSGTAGSNISWTTAMTLDASGNLGIGTSSPSSKLTVLNDSINIESSNTSSERSYLWLGKYSGSSSNIYGTHIGCYHNYGVTSASSLIISPSNVDVLSVDSGGNTLHISPLGGLGYGLGSGGTVTQLTSKGTNVTLNKPTGKIIMNNSALAAGASVQFVLLSSIFSANDLLAVNIVGGIGNALLYRIESVNTTTGGAYIRLTNLSGGSLSEAVEVAFAIIKGATA